MNNVVLIGRMVRDPEVRYTPSTQKAVARFTLAIDRPVGQGKEKQTDFPNIIAFGKTAELVERFVKKGQQVAIEGRIQTGSYTKQDGTKVYTTTVLANKIKFLGNKNDSSNLSDDKQIEDALGAFENMQEMNDDLPF